MAGILRSIAESGILGPLGSLASELIPPNKEHIEETWIVFGEKGAGKHELLAALAYRYVDGFPHAKNYADTWQDSFHEEDDDTIEDKTILLLGLDPQDPQRMLNDAKKYLQPGKLDFPCFLVDIRRFMQEGDSAMQKLFAQYLFFWRALLRICQIFSYDGVWEQESMELVDNEYFGEGFSPSTLQWTVVATHMDEIQEKSRDKVKRSFRKAHETAMRNALKSTFGELFEQISNHVSFYVIFADLYHKNGRTQFFSDFNSLSEE